jgi:hypothetical protein
MASFVTLATTPAQALDEIVTARGWRQVDYAENRTCRAEVRGNGKTYRIAGSGFAPGEPVDIRLANANLKALEYRDMANGDGDWRRFYVPFLWNTPGGLVTVTVTTPRCRLALDFTWERSTVGLEAR